MKSFRQKAKLLGMGILAVLAVILVLQNMQTVDTRLWLFPVRMPLALLLALTLLIGFVFGMLAALRVARKRP